MQVEPPVTTSTFIYIYVFRNSNIFCFHFTQKKGNMMQLKIKKMIIKKDHIFDDSFYMEKTNRCIM